ncbi:MAG TPA: hypothetical protein VFB50_21175, partial [Chloroflexota bacterium]|nr:hypothetical protein [Chloroflexota bacterium]
CVTLSPVRGTGHMELLVMLVSVILLEIAAMLWGYDSRESAQSAEKWFAAHGFRWGGQARMNG